MADRSADASDEDALPLHGFPLDERYDFRLPPANGEPLNLPAQHPARPDAVTTKPGKTPIEPLEVTPKGDSADPLIGTYVGNFEVVDILGRGGFGTVYRARDTKLDRPVALKFLRFPLDAEYRKLFSREAKVLANLSKNPNIVQIYAWGEHQGSYYFALEFLDTSAAVLLKQSDGGLPVRRALEIIVECAGALHYAHQNGVLHRDVKPANILIDMKDNRAKMCDFGLAKFHTFGEGTVTLHAAGSPPYMAPEQVTGGALDARTDVYGLGVTLYELLSGHLPFEGSSQAALLDRIVRKKSTPLSHYRPDLPAPLTGLVERAMAWEPRDRFHTAGELRDAAARLLKTMDSSGTIDVAVRPTIDAKALPRRLTRVIGAAALAVLILGGSYAGWNLFGSLRGAPDAPSGWPLSVAHARELIDSGKYTEALAALNALLKSEPGNDLAKYALGFTHFLLKQYDDAEQIFGQITDTSLRLEGIAAIKRARENEGARSALEDALKAVPTRYPALLLASLDIVKGDYTQAVSHLEQVSADQLHFEWQRRQLHELLGQAYYKTGAIDLAMREFGGISADSSVAAGYLELEKAKQKAEDREAIRQQVKDLRVAWDAAGGSDDQDTWTSRPMTLRLEPIEGDGGAIGRQNALADLLPIGVKDALSDAPDVPIRYVDRASIDAVLNELETSASLASDADSLQMKRFVAARLVMRIKFAESGQSQFLNVQAVDTETTVPVLAYPFPFTEADDYTMLATRISEMLAAKVEKQYPIRARLTMVDGQPALNVGRAVGVKTGMIFELLAKPDTAPLQGQSVEVIAVLDKSATVRLEGLSPKDIPRSGLYAEQNREG